MEGDKIKMISIFKSLLNTLRDNDALTGEKALTVITNFIVLKLMEPHVDDLDMFNPDHYESILDMNDRDQRRHFNTLIKYTKFSELPNLVKDREGDLITNIEFLWNDILNIHPITSKIFDPFVSLGIKQLNTYKTLIKKISELPDSEHDIIGEAYEEVIKDIMVGKVLGQFFTPSIIRKTMIELVKPKLFRDGTIESIADPAMGVGGFLKSSLDYIKKKADRNNVELDWNDVKEKIYGREIVESTYHKAITNLFISTGHIFDTGLELGDSVRTIIKGKYDVVLANPPFGIDGLKYDDIRMTEEQKNAYIPIKTDNAVSLFIQIIISMLKIGGRCAMVLPDGQDLFGSTGALVAVREYLMKTCDLQKVIQFPSDVFNNTSIKTCVIYFVKVREGNEAIQIRQNKTKTGKLKKKEYTFVDDLTSEVVKFYKFTDAECTQKKCIVAVPVEEYMIDNGFNLNWKEYIDEGDDVEEECAEGVEWKELGDVMELGRSGKTNSKDITNTGEYPFYKASCTNPKGTHNNYDFDDDEYLLIVKSGGSSKKPISENYGIGKVFIVRGKCAANVAVFQLTLKLQSCSLKYIYIYLLYIQNKIQSLANYATNNGNIDMKKLMKIRIPIPPLQIQTEIVQQCDTLNDFCSNTSNTINGLNEINKIHIKGVNYVAGVEWKELGEVCEITFGTRIVKKNNTPGPIPVYGSGRETFTTTEYNRENYNIVVGRFALSEKCVRIINDKFFLNDSGLTLKPNTEELVEKFLGYYILNIQDIIYGYARGSAQKNLDIEKFKSIQIPIPPLQIQNQIVQQCDENNELIKSLEQKISDEKNLSKKILNDAIYGSTSDSNQD